MTLGAYFAAGGRSDKEILLTNVVASERDGVLFARGKLPYASEEKPVVIYSQLLGNGEREYRTISAKCPHQGADISHDPLKADGNVYCSIHRRPIGIFSEYNHAYLTQKRDDGFYILKSEG